MAKNDWKDLLGSIATSGSEASEGSNVSSHSGSNPDKDRLSAKTASDSHSGNKAPVQDLVIRFEKRGGKPATIVSRFNGTEAELKELAASLKKHCGTGGSAKDDEILIQGDVRTKVVAFLQAKGYRVKGDFKQ